MALSAPMQYFAHADAQVADVEASAPLSPVEVQ
jgi:hypothetical protein